MIGAPANEIPPRILPLSGRPLHFIRLQHKQAGFPVHPDGCHIISSSKHLTQRRKHLLSFASPMTRPVVPPKIAETVSRRWHQTLTQSHPQSAPRRTPEIGDHSTSKRDWTAVTSLHLTQRPLPDPPPPPSIINERNHQRILRQKKKKKMTTSFTPSNQPCRTLGRPS